MKALDELNNDQIKALIGAGYRTVDDLRNVSVDELVKEVGLETDLAQQIAQEVPLFKHKDFSAEHKHLPVSYTHLRAHETDSYLVCRLLLEKKKNNEY